jgi:integrase/recombinase XerD
MNDLSIPTNFERAFPTTIEGLKKAWTIFDSIKNFEDIEREFLLGRGLSPNTYRNYLGAVKDFYKFTRGIHPLQVKPADIERYYDHLVKRVDRNTAYLYVRGLKKFFSGIRDVIPIYSSPFDTMDEKLNQKLSRTKKGNRTKKALSPAEVRRLLAWLRLDTSIQGKENYTIVYMLVTSGLRADELCQLHWKDLEYYEGKWTAYFVGKGGKEAEQELYEPAVNACCEYFKKAFNRDPDPEDALFWTVPSYPGDTPRPLPYAALWHRIKKIGSNVKEEGIIKRNINFSPHLFRRSYATGLYKSGMGIRAIQEKTRHASIETLVKHYIHDEEPASKYLDLMLA